MIESLLIQVLFVRIVLLFICEWIWLVHSRPAAVSDNKTEPWLHQTLPNPNWSAHLLEGHEYLVKFHHRFELVGSTYKEGDLTAQLPRIFLKAKEI
jgi:hypothetical protein